MTKKLRNRILLIFVLLVIGAPIVMAAAWIGTETVIERTSGAEFCTRCHTMEPFAEAHAKDVHGGDNAGGVVAVCTDCHLPHDSAFSHLVAKAQTGLRDAWAQAIYIFHKPDWVAGLEEREHYVYDSGCLSCHQALERMSEGNPVALAAHGAYFSGQLDKACVACHQHVGHEDLLPALARHFKEVSLISERSDDAGGSETASGQGSDG